MPAVGQERMEEEEAKYAKEQKRHGAAARPLWILKPTLGARGELQCSTGYAVVGVDSQAHSARMRCGRRGNRAALEHRAGSTHICSGFQIKTVSRSGAPLNALPRPLLGVSVWWWSAGAGAWREHCAALRQRRLPHRQQEGEQQQAI